MPRQAALSKLDSKLNWGSITIATYILIFLAIRLINITAFPLHIDEVTHIFRAKATLTNDFFIGMRGGGKQTYIWLVALFFQFFDDPILAARVVSVLSGLITGGICYLLTEMLYPERRIGYLAALFYLISPYTLLYDRMALTDSLVATLMGASLLVSLQLWRQPTVKWALIVGVVFGLAALTKGYTALYYPIPILLWLLFGRKISWAKIAKLLTITYTIAAVAWIPIFIIGQQVYYQEYIIKKTIVGSVEVESNFFLRSWHNLLLITDWLSGYLTLPFVGLIIFSLVRIVMKRDKPGFVLILSLIVPLLVFTLAFTDLYSRYLLPVIVPLSVIVAWGINDLVKLIFTSTEKLKSKTRLLSSHSAMQGAIFLVFCIPSLLFSYLIITEPIQAPFPAHDKKIYVIQAQSAQGYKELTQLMEQLIQRYGNLIFLRNALHSPLEVMLNVYLPDTVIERTDIIDIHDFNQVTVQSLNSYATQAPTLTTTGELIASIEPKLKSLNYSQLWPVASFFDPYQTSDMAIHQWLLPPDFAIHWLQQAGDPDPTIVWYASDALITATSGTLVDWTQFPATNPEAMQQALTTANIEYILATPALINHQPELFAPFITTDGATLALKQLPPDWRLSFAYPDLNCQWCLFQLKPPDQSTYITFGEAIVLEGYDLSMAPSSDDQSLHLTLYWQSLVPLPEEPYIIFVHLLDSNGQLVDQVDEPPLQGQWPTNHWRTGDRLADRHTLPLSSELPAGNYTISVGLYNPTNMARVPARSVQNPVTDNAVILTTISIENVSLNRNDDR